MTEQEFEKLIEKQQEEEQKEYELIAALIKRTEQMKMWIARNNEKRWEEREKACVATYGSHVRLRNGAIIICERCASILG